jgi:hypothetical protein
VCSLRGASSASAWCRSTINHKSTPVVHTVHTVHTLTYAAQAINSVRLCVLLHTKQHEVVNHLELRLVWRGRTVTADHRYIVAIAASSWLCLLYLAVRLVHWHGPALLWQNLPQ